MRVEMKLSEGCRGGGGLSVCRCIGYEEEKSSSCFLFFFVSRPRPESYRDFLSCAFRVLFTPFVLCCNSWFSLSLTSDFYFTIKKNINTHITPQTTTSNRFNKLILHNTICPSTIVNYLSTLRERRNCSTYWILNKLNM